MENTETKPTAPQQDQLAKIKSNAEKRFEVVTKMANDLALRCGKIEINDDTTLALAQQTLSEANRIFKMIEEKRVEIKSPYLQAGKEIDRIAGTILKPLEDALEKGKDKLREWNKKQDEVANAQKLLNEKKYNFLKSLERQIEEKIKLCTSVDNYNQLAANINSKWPAKETFGTYGDDAIKIKDNFITLIKTKVEILNSANGNTAEAANIVAEKIEEAKSIENKVAETSAIIDEKKDIAPVATSKSSVRKTWKHEVVDEMKLPRQFLSADDKKIREYFSSKLKEKTEYEGLKEVTVGGVRFYIDEVPTIR